jgi:hypothetical protein
MCGDDIRPGSGDYDLREQAELRTENRFREWAAIAVRLASEWDKRIRDSRREHDRAHNGIRNPFTIDGVKAVQPVDPGGESNKQLAKMWPQLVAMLGPRRTTKPTQERR